MTMILMYVSSQTVPESAIEDDGSKNKMQPRIRNLENKILQNMWICLQSSDKCRISLQCYQKKTRK